MKPSKKGSIEKEVTEAKKEEVEKIKHLISFHPLNPPYSYAGIEKDPAGRLRYYLMEPTLTSSEAEALNFINEVLVAELDVSLIELGSREKAEKYLKEKVRQIVRKYKIKIKKRGVVDKLSYYIIRDFLGYGKIDGLMRDPDIEDISCNGPGVPIYVWHRTHESIPTNVLFETEEELEAFAVRLAYMSGRHISLAKPVLDASLPDGSRIQLNYGKEVSRKGTSFTIRKWRADPLTVVDLIKYNTLSSEMAAYLWFMIENRVSVLIAGGIAAGKTTTLNVLATFIKPDLKIVTIEDTAEIRLFHENWLPQVTRTGLGGPADIQLFDLLKAAVRQRPDYIMVGEVRGAEAYTLFQAMATGHLGMATIHAESMDAVIHRLESEPMNIPRTLLTTLDLVAVQRRVIYGGQVLRRIISLHEIIGIDPATKELITNEVFRWNPVNDAYERLRRSYRLEEVARVRGMEIEEVEKEIRRRKEVLEWMVKNNIRRYDEVVKVITEYYTTPEKVYKRAKVGAV